MTIAIALKINDGIVLASDSATTLMNHAGGVHNVYNHANKTFNLYKGLPIGGLTWGAGNIGSASISTLVKDLRRRFTRMDPGEGNWALDPASYSMESVAWKVRKFFMESYDPYRSAQPNLSMGFLVAGYSAGQRSPEFWKIILDNGQFLDPICESTDESSWLTWSGDPEAVNRLVLGFGSNLPTALIANGVPPSSIGSILKQLSGQLAVSLFDAAMPVQDAIDLCEFLVHVSIMYSRFRPGAATVGGPIEIATITKHEGFKWIRRKHYYSPDLNQSPERP